MPVTDVLEQFSSTEENSILLASQHGNQVRCWVRWYAEVLPDLERKSVRRGVCPGCVSKHVRPSCPTRCSRRYRAVRWRWCSSSRRPHAAVLRVTGHTSNDSLKLPINLLMRRAPLLLCGEHQRKIRATHGDIRNTPLNGVCDSCAYPAKDNRLSGPQVSGDQVLVLLFDG